jgi:AcrR family transcriptional regulator
LLADRLELVPAQRHFPGPKTSIVASNPHAFMVLLVGWLYNQSMGRPSLRAERRAELIEAFARVLADHGYAGATIAAVARQAGVAPGLVHHHFADKAELLESLLGTLLDRFRQRTRALEAGSDPLLAYAAAAVQLDATADAVAARCWVGVFAEACATRRCSRRSGGSWTRRSR